MWSAAVFDPALPGRSIDRDWFTGAVGAVVGDNCATTDEDP